MSRKDMREILRGAIEKLPEALSGLPLQAAEMVLGAEPEREGAWACQRAKTLLEEEAFRLGRGVKSLARPDMFARLLKTLEAADKGANQVFRHKRGFLLCLFISINHTRDLCPNNPREKLIAVRYINEAAARAGSLAEMLDGQGQMADAA